MNYKYEPLKTLEIERKKRGLSRQELAKLSEINEFTIQALELGKNNPRQAKLETLLALCNALKVNLSVLFPNERRIK